MSVIFKIENHTYTSQDPNEKINWLSVTRFVEMFKEPFDPVAVSEKCSKNKKSKWYGIKPEVIRSIWDGESTRASSTGDFYHAQRESDIGEFNSIVRDGINIPIFRSIIKEGIKYAPEQKLSDGVYPEHFVYLKSAGICGQSDRVEVIKGQVDIIDYKTNKEIKKESYKNWEGISKKMLGPLSHLDDCNFNHYALQLSIYMYILIKHNPRLIPRDMVLQHVIFQKEGDDMHGYPILKKTQGGGYLVDTVVLHKVPYLKNEVRDMINYKLDNKL